LAANSEYKEYTHRDCSKDFSPCPKSNWTYTSFICDAIDSDENRKTEIPSVENKPLSKIMILVTTICWLAIFMEGYDLVIYGVVLPSLMEPSQWGLSPTQAGAMGSYALLGMFMDHL